MKDLQALRRIVLARHGQTDWNTERRFQGKTDIALNDEGKAQAHALAKRLSSWQTEAVYSSPLQRALYTAQAVAAHQGLVPIVLDGLTEVDFGTWEGRSIPILEKENKEALARWRGDPFFRPPAGAETWDSIAKRLERAVEVILSEAHHRVILVSHGGIIRALYAIMVGLDPHRVWKMNVSNCAMSGVELGPSGASLMFANDDLHIRAGEAGQSLPVW